MNSPKARKSSKDKAQLLKDLEGVLSPKQVLSDKESLDVYGKDWTGGYTSSPSAVLFPKTTSEVQQITQYANQHGIALVPSGGRTGLSGGACATKGEFVVSFEKMKRVIDFNKTNKTITCEAGIITDELRDHIAQKGFFYPVDFASAGSSHIGGNIATNAGGINVIRYGMTREWVAGLTVVTGKGDILKLDKNLIKNNAGYDMKQLFIGSEGTLGFITEVTMRFTSPPKPLHVMLLGINQFSDIMHVLNTFQHEMKLNAFEFFSNTALTHVISHFGLSNPLSTETAYYALIEFEGPSDIEIQKAMSLFETCLENEWIIDGILNQNETQKATIWRLREDITEAISQYTPYKNDVSVSVSKVPDFLSSVNQLFSSAYPDFEIVWFGHIADGNVHLSILKPDTYKTPDFIKKCESVTTHLFELVETFNGSISAEHGVGLLKAPYLNYQYSQTELSYMKSLKSLFDPNNIMNPGKMLKMREDI